MLYNVSGARWRRFFFWRGFRTLLIGKEISWRVSKETQGTVFFGCWHTLNRELLATKFPELILYYCFGSA
jgi:hypothetical protein